MSRPLHDYGFVSDGHGAALIARDGAIDWCCLPRFDHGSCFAALLDEGRGGRLSLTAAGGGMLAGEQRYVPDSLVFETTLRGDGDGAGVRVTDALTAGDERRLLRVVEGVEGRLDLRLRAAVRFDYGAVRPWLRRDAPDVVWAIGCDEEGRRFGRFALRSAAGHADEMQIVFGIDGERHLDEREVDLCGYGGARPVRVGNGAAGQMQLDALGELVALAWTWHRRGAACDEDEWRFVRSLVDTAARRWREPDRGIWEWRAQPRHFVHSKAACWAALDCGLRLADDLGADVDRERRRRERDAIRTAVFADGWDQRRGCFRQALGAPELDAAALLLPVTGIVG